MCFRPALKPNRKTTETQLFAILDKPKPDRLLVDLAPGIDSILLLVDVAAATSRAVLFDVPPAVAVGYYLM